MGKKLRELVERLAAEPTAANRDAFRRGLLMSSVWTPLRPALEGDAGARHPPGPMTPGPDGAPTLLVYADGHSALREPGVRSAGGGSGRLMLERALAAGVGLMVTTGHEPTAARAVVPRGEVAAVLESGRWEDPTLGAIVWYPLGDDDNGFWEFEAGPVGGHSVTGVVVPKVAWEPIAPGELPRIRQTVQWVRANDPAIRAHIATQMWEWWSEEYCDSPDLEEVATPEAFRDTLELEVIRFEPGADVFLDYADHGLVQGYGIRIYVSPDGRFTDRPMVC